MLFQTLSVSESAHLLLSDDNASWSYEGAHAMAKYLDDLQEDCGGDWSFSVVDVRCDYTELSLESLISCYGYLTGRNYPSDPTWIESCDEAMEELLDTIRDNTHCMIELDNGGYIVSYI